MIKKNISPQMLCERLAEDSSGEEFIPPPIQLGFPKPPVSEFVVEDGVQHSRQQHHVKEYPITVVNAKDLPCKLARYTCERRRKGGETNDVASDLSTEVSGPVERATQ